MRTTIPNPLDIHARSTRIAFYRDQFSADIAPMRIILKLGLILIVAAIALPAVAQTVSPQFDLSRSRIELLRKINRRISDISTLQFESSLVFAYGQAHQTWD